MYYLSDTLSSDVGGSIPSLATRGDRGQKSVVKSTPRNQSLTTYKQAQLSTLLISPGISPSSATLGNHPKVLAMLSSNCTTHILVVSFRQTN